MARDGNVQGKMTGRNLSALLRQMFESISHKPATPELLDLVDQLDGAADPEVEEPAADPRVLALA